MVTRSFETKAPSLELSEAAKKHMKERATALSLLIILSIALLYLSAHSFSNAENSGVASYAEISLSSQSKGQEVAIMYRSQQYLAHLNEQLYAAPGEVILSQATVREWMFALQHQAVAQDIAPTIVFPDRMVFESLRFTDLLEGVGGAVVCHGEQVALSFTGGISTAETHRPLHEAAQILFTAAHEVSHMQVQNCQRLFDGALASASTTAFVEGTASLIALEMLAGMYLNSKDETPKELVRAAILYGLTHIYTNDIAYRQLRLDDTQVDLFQLARVAGYGPLSLATLRFALQNPEEDVLVYIEQILGVSNIADIFYDLPNLPLTQTVRVLRGFGVHLP